MLNVSKFVILSLVGGTSLTKKVFSNPELPGLEYPVVNMLGEGRFGTVYSVKLPNGKIAAMKEETMNLITDDIELAALEAVSGSPHTGPSLLTSYSVRYSPTQKKRMTLMTLLGPTLCDYVRKLRLSKLEEHTAASIGIQIVEATQRLHSLGFLHNDIHWENVALEHPGNADNVVLLDFGLSSRISMIPIDTLSEECIAMFSPAKVFKDFIANSFPEVTSAWFKAAVETNVLDEDIVKFISENTLPQHIQVAIEKARIVSQIVQGRRSSIKLDNIIKAMTDVSAVAEDGNLVICTRELVQFLKTDALPRLELVRIIRTYTELMGIYTLDHRDGTVWEIVEGDTFDMTTIEGLPVHSIDTVKFAWEVMRGREPDLSVLRGIFLNIIDNLNRTYTDKILW